MAGSKNIASRFIEDRQGNFALMTALLMVPLLLAAGLVVDYSTATVEHANMQEIADAAALAGGRVYDGTNAAAAKAAAKGFLDGYSDRLPAGSAYDISMDGDTINVSVHGPVGTSFMGLAGMNSVSVAVGASAITPMKPKSVTFSPTKAQGYYYKKVSIIVVRPNSTAEEVVGTVTYQPTTHEQSGQGTMTVSPSPELELGKYSKLVLQMDIKNDGCGLGQQAVVTGSDVACVTNTSIAYQKYDLTLRTDNPDTTQYLFVDKVQLPKGVASPLDTILQCGQTLEHAWEDGGGWARQDFFYTVSSECAPDGEFVRLTK